MSSSKWKLTIAISCSVFTAGISLANDTIQLFGKVSANNAAVSGNAVVAATVWSNNPATPTFQPEFKLEACGKTNETLYKKACVDGDGNVKTVRGVSMEEPIEDGLFRINTTLEETLTESKKSDLPSSQPSPDRMKTDYYLIMQDYAAKAKQRELLQRLENIESPVTPRYAIPPLRAVPGPGAFPPIRSAWRNN